MISSKNAPDFIFEDYNGYTIASHKNNIPEPDINNLIIVYRSDEFPNHGFIVGLDDSKTSGNRKSIPNNIDDAKNYIDWVVKVSQEKAAIKPENTIAEQKAYDLRVNKGMLPTIQIAGHTFYVDLSRDKLRPKDDFLSNGIVFSDIGTYYDSDKGAYTIPYNPKKHEFQEPDYDKITEFPRNLIAVQFPFQQQLDPVGWNRLLDKDINTDLKTIGLKSHYAAKTIPWEQTFLDGIIKENLARMNKEEKKQKIMPAIPHPAPRRNKGKRL